MGWLSFLCFVLKVNFKRVGALLQKKNVALKQFFLLSFQWSRIIEEEWIMRVEIQRGYEKKKLLQNYCTYIISLLKSNNVWEK